MTNQIAPVFEADDVTRVTGLPPGRMRSALLNELAGCVPTSDDRLDRVGAAFDSVGAFGPRDAVEAMMATQAVALHVAAMDALRRAKSDTSASFAKVGAKLSAQFIATVEALERRRSGGAQQRVRVEHVTVEAGGQAIVGTVAMGGGTPGGWG